MSDQHDEGRDDGRRKPGRPRLMKRPQRLPTAQVEAETLDALRREAAERRTPLSVVIREYLDRVLREPPA